MLHENQIQKHPDASQNPKSNNNQRTQKPKGKDGKFWTHMQKSRVNSETISYSHTQTQITSWKSYNYASLYLAYHSNSTVEEVVNAIGDLEEGRGRNDDEERRRLERVTVRRGEDWRALRERESDGEDWVTFLHKYWQRKCETQRRWEHWERFRIFFFFIFFFTGRVWILSIPYPKNSGNIHTLPD